MQLAWIARPRSIAISAMSAKEIGYREYHDNVAGIVAPLSYSYLRHDYNQIMWAFDSRALPGCLCAR
jgi:hypothetical protein